MDGRQSRESSYIGIADEAYELVNSHSGPGYAGALKCRSNGLLYAFLE